MQRPFRLAAQPASRRFAFAAAALVLLACNAPVDSPAPTDRPTLRLIDSIFLQESDSSLLSDPGPYFVIDEQGRMYIPDEQSGRIQRYGAHGEFEMTFGRRGRGPGEFGFVGPVLLVVDTMLLVEANFQRRIHVFSTVSGNFLYSVPFAGINIWSAVATEDKLIWGHYDYNGPYTVMLANADSVLHGPIVDAPVLRSSQHVRPEVFKDYPELDTFSSVPLVAWADTVVFGYGPTDWLVRATLDGTAIDTFTVPVARRRGATREGLELFRMKDFRIEDAYAAISAAVALWRSSKGEIVVWHQDGSLERPSPNKLLIAGTAWISLLSADLTRACVDAEVTTPGTDRPRLALRGDTLYVFDQLMDDAASGTIRSVIRRYHLSSEGCTWLPLARKN
jgi:hypothetical protein